MSLSPTAITVLASANPFVPAAIAGVDPRAIPAAIKALLAAGEIRPVPPQDGCLVRQDTSFRVAPTDAEEQAVTALCGFLTSLATPDPKQPRFRCGVVPAGWHGKATSFGGGCSDDIDLEMRDTFLTRCTDKSDKPQLDVEALRQWGEEIGLWNPKWEALNPGMQRMNLTNRVRAAIRKGTEIVLNGKTFTDTGARWQTR